jgi:hypothetical protein
MSPIASHHTIVFYTYNKLAKNKVQMPPTENYFIFLVQNEKPAPEEAIYVRIAA